MTTLYLFRYRCSDGIVYDEWLSEEPQFCKVHPTESITAQIVDTISEEKVMITDDSTGTGGRFRTEGFEITVKPKSEGATQREISWPYYNVSVTDVGYLGEDENKGDSISMCTGHGTVIGVLISEAPLGSNTFVVNTTALDNSYLANSFILKDGNGDIEDLGEIIAVDKDTSSVTVEKSSSKTYPVGSVILTEFVRVKNMPLNSARNILFGAASAGNSFVPKGTRVMVHYENKEEKEKTFRFYTEMRI